MSYLTREEAAKHLRISTRTLDRLIAEGEIIGARIGGRRLLFRPCDLDAYVAKLMRQAAV
ncbi:MAG: helix-turn-helix domain-containing protein [bacterium]|nr:helix-turn-helix domain-containing protein [bacterium]